MSLIQVIGGRELSVVSSFWNTKGWEVGGLTVLVFQPHRWGWILSFFFTCWYSNNRYKWLVFSQMPYLFSVIIIVIIIIILSGVSQWEVIGCHSWVWAVSSWHLVAEARTPVNIPQCAGHSHYRYTGLQTWLVPGGGVQGAWTQKKIPACLSFENQSSACWAAISENLSSFGDAGSRQDLRILRCTLIFPWSYWSLFICLLTCIWNSSSDF